VKSNQINQESQRSEILYWLRNNPSLNTLQARKKLGIMHPSGRVLELRQQGHNIITHWSTAYDALKQPHRVAQYVLLSGKYRGGEK
jgi:hypothetical protein